jgi:ketosteroid isomerase-like protein
MPEESAPTDPIERTYAVYAALNSRDFDAVVGMFGPSPVWDVSCWGLGAKAGPEAIRHFLDDWFGSLDEYRVEVEEIHVLGEGVVWAVVLQSARRGGSRGLLQMRSAPVFLWAQGRISQVTLYRDIDEARAEAQRLAQPQPG